ncbi:nuclear transport factor 2 family protein [Aquimarina sp. 2201CG5-10]|uniref:nuclear transport factor 2 family protein n=1 Tax=Aquimarina callyspongiae TaxID=3098150 RepID=UPI002AB3D11F|nr:nuclear transport factor 2 family protein [Aquimarina sp. 2201CG5-10]MDY8135663.1 nuclear transport factor 2 family protein [Aquimarina sp. 2201CG5-10]
MSAVDNQSIKEQIAKDYLLYLEEGNMNKVVDLFAENGMVVSPLYGTQSAREFYKILAGDTSTSELKFDGLFYEKNSNRISLLFDYIWGLKDGKKVQFKVVDIIELDTNNKIEKLSIIYDTIHSRTAVEQMKNE